MPNDSERGEYILNDNGVIYMGSADNVTQRAWMYGQVHAHTETHLHPRVNELKVVSWL